MKPKRFLEKELSEIVGRLYGFEQIPVMPTVEITTPDPVFGDFSTNIALRLSKIIKQSPKDIAESSFSKNRLGFMTLIILKISLKYKTSRPAEHSYFFRKNLEALC